MARTYLFPAEPPRATSHDLNPFVPLESIPLFPSQARPSCENLFLNSRLLGAIQEVLKSQEESA